MNDDTTSQQTLDAPQTEPVAASSAPIIGGDVQLGGEEPETAAAGAQPTFKPSVIRTRVIPLFALAMVVSLLGLLAYSLFGPKDRLPEGRVNASGAIVTENGRMAPDFTLSTFDGGTFHLADYRGKTVIVNFWASWCEPCKAETPLLTTASPSLPPDVVLVGVNVMDTRASAQSFADDYRVNYPVGDDAKDNVAVDYGITGVPETFVINPEGRIIARLPGPVTRIQQLNDMIAEAR